MVTTASNVPATKTVVAHIPYLNCDPFFQGLALEGSWEWMDCSPRQLGLEAEAGRVTAGPMALVDFFRLQDSFERLGSLGIAVRGRCGSAMLCSSKPVRQLDGATIAVTEETSTTALLLRLILEIRFGLAPKQYMRGAATDDVDGVLLIGDEALKFRVTNRRFPYETDLAFEWWLWQHLPIVFAVWAIRKDCAPPDKQRLSRLLQQQLAHNLGRLDELASARAASLGVPAEELAQYLSHFIYRLSDPEERAIKQFEHLLHEHHLL